MSTATRFRTKNVALVTGGNRGIGFEACRQLAVRGFGVILTARDAVKGMKAAKTLQAEGLDVTFLRVDVTSDQSIAEAVRGIADDPGRIDVLVNNAGVYLDEGNSLTTIDPSLFLQTIDTNLGGTYRMIRAVIPMMERQKYGRIVNVSSGLGSMDSMSAGTGSYKVSKLALNGLTRVMADEVNDKQIKINCMCPGWVRTDMGGSFAPRSPKKATETILWLAELDETGPTGGFFRDKKAIDF